MTNEQGRGDTGVVLLRDGPWLVAQTQAGELRMLIGEGPEARGFVDVEVVAKDGRRFVGTVGTLADVADTMGRWAMTGECLQGRYFWIADLVVVASLDPTTIAAVMDDLDATGELAEALSLVD
jgi:hypothetical protein